MIHICHWSSHGYGIMPLCIYSPLYFQLLCKKKLMEALCCHGNCDVKKTQIVTNFHSYLIQQW